MSDVKRYDPINKDGTCGVCIEDADYGAYVEYADYAALEAELAKLKGELARLRAVPDGWKLVPVEPTSEMLDRYPFNVSVQLSDAMDTDDLRVVYQAMLRAAPTPS